MLVLDFRQCRDMLGSLLDDVNVKPFKVQCREMLGSLLDDVNVKPFKVLMEVVFCSDLPRDKTMI